MSTEDDKRELDEAARKAAEEETTKKEAEKAAEKAVEDEATKQEIKLPPGFAKELAKEQVAEMDKMGVFDHSEVEGGGPTPPPPAPEPPKETEAPKEDAPPKKRSFAAKFLGIPE